MKKPISIFLIAILHLTLVIGHLSFAAEYVLAPSDQLEVRIIGQKDLDTKQAIAPDGTISLPLLGRVTAQGQTLNSFNSYLSTEFAKYIKNNGSISRKEYVKISNISPRQANKDLDELLDKKLISSAGKGRSLRYIVHD